MKLIIICIKIYLGISSVNNLWELKFNDMTPKRYFAFGCLTLLIQGGVIASQETAPISPSLKIQLASGSEHGQRINLNLASQRRTQAKAEQAQVLEPITPPKAAKAANVADMAVVKASSEPKPMTQPEPKSEPKPKPNKIDKPTPTSVKTAAATRTVTKTALLAQKHQNQDPVQKPQASLNQEQILAKQGVTHQAVPIDKPTFAAPPAQPHYPKLARKRGLEGTATIEVMFNHIGEQLSLTLVQSSGFTLLDRAAIEAVEQWQFAAPMEQTAFVYTVKIPVRFALN